MHRFAFTAMSPDGQRMNGFEIAQDEQALGSKLEAADLVLLRAKRVSGPSGNVSARVLIDLFYQVATVSSAGVPILRGLRDLQQKGQHPLTLELESIARAVESGSSLAEALELFPRVFSPMMVALVKAGEETGELDTVLFRLVKFLEWREELIRQVKSALTYPVLVTVVLVVVAGIVGVYVIPEFAILFQEVGVDLPVTLRALLWIKAFLAAHSGKAALGLLLVYGAYTLWQRTPRGRLLRDRAVLRMPLIGDLRRMVELSRFSHNLGLLFGAGLPIQQALGLVAEIVQNKAISRSIGTVTDRVSGGSTLFNAVNETELTTPLVVSMLQVGETTGTLDEALERVSTFYDREVPARINQVVQFFNVAIVVVLGIAVTTLILSILLPIYEMYGEIANSQ